MTFADGVAQSKGREEELAQEDECYAFIHFYTRRQ